LFGHMLLCRHSLATNVWRLCEGGCEALDNVRLPATFAKPLLCLHFIIFTH
jgi:hypothetical protein